MFNKSGAIETLARELRVALQENEDLKRTVSKQDADVWNAERKAAAASRPIPANLADLAPQLRGFVPSVVGAPGYTALAKATDAKELASAIHSLLLTAQAAGYRQAQEEGR